MHKQIAARGYLCRDAGGIKAKIKRQEHSRVRDDLNSRISMSTVELWCNSSTHLCVAKTTLNKASGKIGAPRSTERLAHTLQIARCSTLSGIFARRKHKNSRILTNTLTISDLIS